MGERRSLVDGLYATDSPIEPAIAKQFISAAKSGAGNSHENAKSSARLSRTPLSTRIRTDYSVALKRASLERQLKGLATNTLIEILEEAIGPWLKTNGYL